MTERRPIVAVIGAGDAAEPILAVAEELGRLLVDRGYRIVTGGLGGVMEAASRGAHRASAYTEGCVVGILPGPDPAAANPHVDVVVPSNLGHARNTLVVATGSAVVAVGGGAGTLTEIAMAWQLGRPIVAIAVEGWSGELGGRALDDRRPDVIERALDAAEAVRIIDGRLGR